MDAVGQPIKARLTSEIVVREYRARRG
jgi:hypothetical protein